MKDSFKLSLFFLRASCFLVMLMWTLDKIINPVHASKVYEVFYSLSGFQDQVMRVLGFLEMAVIVLFLLGVKKRLTYGLVFVFHFVSTLSSYKQYLNPFESPNLLFFAAFPMLAALFMLYTQRDKDTFLTIRL